MPTARLHQINLEVTSYYHCYVRCVRRAYLLEEGGRESHRKQLIVERLKLLSRVFSIDICAYAIMTNHYHVVLHVNREKALKLTEDEILERLKQLSSRQGSIATPESLKIWRERFYSISWFMRYLNEYIARLANEEEEVTGRFWEGRFKSQALVDEGALLACMAYVDLNPIRAKEAGTLESSDFTSIKARLEAYPHQASPDSLMAFATSVDEADVLPFSLSDYVCLVDWTGRQIKENKGHISSEIPPLVEISGLKASHWLCTIKHYAKPYASVIGAWSAMKDWAYGQGKCWLKGQTMSKRAYLTS